MATHVLAHTTPAAASGNECASVSRRRACHPHVSCGLKSQFLGLRLSLRSHDDDRLLISPICRRPLVVARLFGPAIFEASKLKVLFLGDGKDKRPDELPRAYTLTHSDITAKLTLAVSQTINKAQIQGWYNRLQRDEVLAEWKKSQGSMSLHVHCHISGGHFLLDTIAKLRFYIFRKELPVVLAAFRYGDENLFMNHPELEEALVWVYFHSNVKEFNRLECWGPLREATKGASSSEVAKEAIHNAMDQIEEESRSKQPPNNSDWKRP
ncbi:hypothetical protein GOP47_0014766 [Adiantum capillus-veneris]|uniref:Staygreen protein domain-containing protein n=1 Tax=Adiantum capillus-veneris TaxID=13818 RepID=A0A9D4UM43_ADICA|nr:hypothetical protein GOP47_0014766 [Adiantum capillus-veneris]